MDFHITGEKSVETEIDEYINFFSEQRPAYSLNYLTPVQYRLWISVLPDKRCPVAFYFEIRVQFLLTTAERMMIGVTIG